MVSNQGVGALRKLYTLRIGSGGTDCTDCCSCCLSDMESVERLVSPTSSQTSIRAAVNPETSPTTTHSKSGKKHSHLIQSIRLKVTEILCYSTVKCTHSTHFFKKCNTISFVVVQHFVCQKKVKYSLDYILK